MTMPNPFLEYLEADPRIAYFSYQDQFGANPRQKRHYQNQYSDIYNEYLGFLGKQARSGTMPTGGFNDFLSNFNFGQRYNQLTPRERGDEGSYGQFAPPLRWLIPR